MRPLREWLGKEKIMTKAVLSKKEKTRDMTRLAMFIAIIAVMGLVPSWVPGSTIGFIRITPNMEATLIHIPVLVGAALFGKKYGLWLGLTFGVVSNIAAFIYNPLFFVYPWVAILPRFIFGILIVPIVNFGLKLFKNKYLAVGSSFFVLSLIHSLVTLTMLYTVYGMALHLPAADRTITAYIAALVGGAGFPWASLIEAGLAAVVGGVLVIRLGQYLKIQKYAKNPKGEVQVENSN